MSRLSLENLQILLNNADNFTQKELQQFLECFCFSSLININLLDHESIRLHAMLLDKLTKYDIFFTTLKPVERTLTFVLTDLLAIKDFHGHDILTWLLHLLKVLVEKSKSFQYTKELINMQRDKIFDILISILDLEIFKVIHINDYTYVLCVVFIIDGCLSDAHSQNLSKIINSFRRLDVIYEIAVISQVVIERYRLPSEIFDVSSVWLLTEGSKLLSTANEEHAVLKLMQTLNYFHSKYDSNNSRISKSVNLNNSIEECLHTLSKISDVIVSYATKENLRRDSLKLLTTILTKNKFVSDWDFCYKKLLELPTDPSEWVDSEPEMFLKICCLLCTNNRIMWSPSKIINVIITLVYSHNRFKFTSSFLKMICYIYPFILPECFNRINAVLGDDLLIIISRRHYELNDIFSLHIGQLNWILMRSEDALKKSVICFWLDNTEDSDVLKKWIVRCKAQHILVSIVMDPRLNDKTCIRAAELIRNMQDPDLSIKIGKMLTLVHSTPKFFNRLMISNPGVPKDTNEAQQICEFMSLVMVTVCDEGIFGLACDYSKALITFLKTDVDIINLFCKNYKNILFVLSRLKKLKDEVAIKTMGLLKVLLLVQKRNHTNVNTSIEADVGFGLSGSTNKLEKCLDVLRLLTPQCLFIRMSYASIHPIFLKLFSISEHPDLSDKIWICLTDILKTNKWLATSSTTNLFVETICSLAVNEQSCQEFISFLLAWIKILKERATTEKEFYIAHTGIVKNYILRVPGITRKRSNYLLKSLNALDRQKWHYTPYLKMIMK